MIHQDKNTMQLMLKAFSNMLKSTVKKKTTQFIYFLNADPCVSPSAWTMLSNCPCVLFSDILLHLILHFNYRMFLLVLFSTESKSKQSKCALEAGQLPKRNTEWRRLGYACPTFPSKLLGCRTQNITFTGLPTQAGNWKWMNILPFLYLFISPSKALLFR